MGGVIMRVAVILICITIVSGMIAYLGNQWGRAIGRRKLSVFNLRPRHTSILITVVTGVMISYLTVISAAIFSKPVQIALLGMEGIRKEIAALENQRDDLKKDINNMTDSIRVKETPLYTAGQPILVAVIQTGLPERAIKMVLDHILETANYAAIMRNNAQAAKKKGEAVPQDTRMVYYRDREEYENIIRRLSKQPGKRGVVVRSAELCFLWEPVGVSFEFFEDKLVFGKNEEVIEFEIDGSKSREDVYNTLALILKSRVRAVAEKKGVRPNVEEKLVEASPLDIVDACDRIRVFGGVARVLIRAKREITTAGPLEVRFEISPK